MFVCFFFHFVNTCWHVLCVFCTLGSNLPESPWCENSPGASESHFDLTWPCFFLSTCFRTQMLAAAQSPPPSPRPPPPPPPLGPQSRPPPPGSAAHRRLEADRCYSSSPRQRRRREHRGSTPRVSVWHLKKKITFQIRFYNREPLDLWKIQEKDEYQEESVGSASLLSSPPRSHSSLLLISLCASHHTPGSSILRKPSDWSLTPDCELSALFYPLQPEFDPYFRTAGAVQTQQPRAGRTLSRVCSSLQADHRGDLVRNRRDWKLFSPRTSTNRMVGISASFQCKYCFILLLLQLLFLNSDRDFSVSQPHVCPDAAKSRKTENDEIAVDPGRDFYYCFVVDVWM